MQTQKDMKLGTVDISRPGRAVQTEKKYTTRGSESIGPREGAMH